MRMNDDETNNIPPVYQLIHQATQVAGFDMPSDIKTCSLLRTLAAGKPGGNFLELGTGTGLSTAWILDGMDENSTLLSIDSELEFQGIAGKFLGNDTWLKLIHQEGGKWIQENKYSTFDFIFADTWPGKYELLEETLSLLKTGGYYVVDDMCEQLNWPPGHDLKAQAFMAKLDEIEDVFIIRQVWSTGLILLVKHGRRKAVLEIFTR